MVFGTWFEYHLLQVSMSCELWDNKNIHKAYKESREDDPFELKNISKSQSQMCQGFNPCLMPFLTSLLWRLLIPKWISIIFSKMTFIFIFWVINIWEDTMYVVPMSYGLKCNIPTSKDHVSKVGEVMSLVRWTFKKIICGENALTPLKEIFY